jgi:conjugal transfer pilus assembly protein TraU
VTGNVIRRRSVDARLWVRAQLARALFLPLALVVFAPVAFGGPTCQGRFPNPITDICWSCIFPMSIGGAQIATFDQEDVANPGGNPLCGCPPLRVGIKTGFWEPARLVEVTRTPYCFMTLNGLELDLGIAALRHHRAHSSERASHSFYQVHWYMNPLLYWLEVLLDDACLERGDFDLAYITEVDPLWNDSELAFILNPDVALFANPAAQAVCAADCVAATAGFPRSELFWCAGCQGPMYPLTGHVGAHIGGVQASALLVQRMTNKLHRELLMWAGSGDAGLCGFYPQVLMDKQNYKLQMVHPIPNTAKLAGRCCHPFGRTTAVWGAGKEFPVKGEDFVYQVFRKRNCCATVPVSVP